MSLLTLWKSVTALIARMELQSANVRRVYHVNESLAGMSSDRAGLVVSVAPPSTQRQRSADHGGSHAESTTMTIVVAHQSTAIEDKDTAFESAERIDHAIIREPAIAGYSTGPTELIAIEAPEEHATSGVAIFTLNLTFSKQQTV